MGPIRRQQGRRSRAWIGSLAMGAEWRGENRGVKEVELAELVPEFTELHEGDREGRHSPRRPQCAAGILDNWTTERMRQRLELGAYRMSSALEGASVVPVGTWRWPEGRSRTGLEAPQRAQEGQRHLLSPAGPTGALSFSSPRFLWSLRVARAGAVRADQRAQHLCITATSGSVVQGLQLRRLVEVSCPCASDLPRPAWCPLV